MTTSSSPPRDCEVLEEGHIRERDDISSLHKNPYSQIQCQPMQLSCCLLVLLCQSWHLLLCGQTNSIDLNSYQHSSTSFELLPIHVHSWSTAVTRLRVSKAAHAELNLIFSKLPWADSFAGNTAEGATRLAQSSSRMERSVTDLKIHSRGRS